MDDWTDSELLGYVEIHCETPRALFSWEVVELQYTGPPPAFYPMGRGLAMPLAHRARKRVRANRVYDVLVEHCGAPEPLREDYVYDATDDRPESTASTWSVRCNSVVGEAWDSKPISSTDSLSLA